MRTKNSLQLIFLGGLLLVSIVSATPPYMWYATYSIESYSGNGCSPDNNLSNCHDEADGFNNAIVDPVHANVISNEAYRNNRRDADATATRWTGVDAEVNNVDFLFYSGHGYGYGPFLGCNPAYSLNIQTDVRFHGNGYLKWVQGSACLWFCHPNYANNVDEYTRWNNSFAGVHTVQGHRAITYDVYNTNAAADAFWDHWVNEGASIYDSWRNAQISFIYQNGATPGLQPATMAANGTYGTETFATAQDVAATNGASWLSWATVGTPEYQ